jgi:uncharacterized protein HemX
MVLQLETALKTANEVSEKASTGDVSSIIYLLVLIIFIFGAAIVWVVKLYVDQQKNRIKDKDNENERNRNDTKTLISAMLDTQKQLEILTVKQEELTDAITHLTILHNTSENIEEQLSQALMKVNNFNKVGDKKQAAFWQNHAEQLSRLISNRK